MQSAERDVVVFRIRRQMPMGKLKDAYCSHMGMSKELTYLSFDGQRINDNETAITLELLEDDMLEVLMKRQNDAGDSIE
ncbi:maker126 [Drosophila busckii]|uniref:Maker126 n=2 Tax=Drosophila busckii TaxID=30019 RepID=A0A0M4EIG6_DROBS|nr:maker126 [Drosophila busckii]